MNVAAICDISRAAAERMAQKYAIPAVYEDYRIMLAEMKPDIVSICTTNHLHKQMTIDALEAGANVHLEKPVALNALGSAGDHGCQGADRQAGDGGAEQTASRRNPPM